LAAPSSPRCGSVPARWRRRHPSSSHRMDRQSPVTARRRQVRGAQGGEFMDPLLLLDDPRPRVARGGECRVPVTVQNPGDAPDSYRFEVLGDAGRWSRVEPRYLSDLPAGGVADVDLLVRPPSDAPAGTTPFAVRCVSLGDTGTAYLSVRPRRPKLAGRAVTHRFTVEHRGDSRVPDRRPVRFEQRPVLGAAGATAALLAVVALVVGAGVLAWPSVRGRLPG